MPGSNSRPDVSEGYEVPLSYQADRSLRIGMYMYICMYVCTVITYSKGKDQPGKVANPARGQLNICFCFSLSPFAPENLVSRDESGSPVPRQPAHFNTQAESITYGIPPEFRGGVYLFI